MEYSQSMPRPLHSTRSVKDHKNLLRVSGEGSVSVPPNQAIITLGALTENKNLTAAQEENAKTMTKIIESLKALGISDRNLQTVIYRIDPQYDFENGKPILQGYLVHHQLQVINDQIQLTGRIIDTAVQNGANSVTTIQFTVTPVETYYFQALSNAIKNAQQKALTISNDIGVVLNKVPSSIQEVQPSISPIPYSAALMTPTPIQQGEIKVNAKIIIEYTYS
ncbi:SIMPL domain-containing protein [Bacillus sp. 03113]|uniref:SIMPL domain-containing protein n=1 Tax=Bacillus sp. 03113 TaxID=2578211 RepID=UPI001144610D|nr:SIMPL domain-containing protein [Bacillus sp. 03113]